MNAQEQVRWKNAVLDQVLAAFAAHAPLRDALVFKGARILSLRLGEYLRQSLDVDSNLALAFAEAHSRLEDQQEYLKRETDVALRHFFSRQDPVRYAVETTKVAMRPADGQHPFGWTGFLVSVRVRDNQRPGVLGLPAIEVDVAAPEKLRASSRADLAVSGFMVQAYTMERLAGEKMRAFLSSLPTYIAKIDRRTDSCRVKDLYDLARIRRRWELSKEVLAPTRRPSEEWAAAVTMGHPNPCPDPNPDPCPLTDRGTTRIMTRIATRMRARTPGRSRVVLPKGATETSGR